MGAKIAAPERQVVAVTGDGGFQMSIFELGTIAANNIDLKMVLSIPHLGMVREIQKRVAWPDRTHCPEKNPNFVMLASAWHKGRTRNQ